MTHKFLTLGLLGFLATEVHAQERPIHTFSIVARDSVTGELGVAVQSHWFSVGVLVPWVEAGEYTLAEQMQPNNLEMKYWHAVSLVNVGKIEESLPIFKVVFQADPNWAELTPRLPKVDLLKVDEAGLKRILSVSKK